MKTDLGRYKGRALALSAVTLTALSGCGSLTTSDDSDSDSGSDSSPQASSVEVCGAPEKRIGYVTINDSSPTAHRVTEAVQATTETLGWELLFIDGQSNFTTMAQAVTSFVNENVDAILVGFSDAAPLREGLEAAQAKDIPVIQIGGGVQPSPLYTASYEEDEEQMGQLVGEMIIENVPDARIADLATSLNYTGVARGNGLKAAIEASGGEAEIVASQQVDLTNAAASTTQILTGMITANPDINAVHAVFDPMAVPAGSALNTAGNDAQIYTYYASESNLALMERGQLHGVIEVNVVKTAAVAIDQVLQLDETGAINPDALEEAGGLDYTPVTSADADVASDQETLEPFLTQWATDFPC